MFTFAVPSGLLHLSKQAAWFKQEPQQQHTELLLLLSSAFPRRCAKVICEEGCRLGLKLVPYESSEYN